MLQPSERGILGTHRLFWSLQAVTALPEVTRVGTYAASTTNQLLSWHVLDGTDG